MKKLLTIPETAKILNCSRSTVYRLVDEGKLQGCKIRNSLRIIAKSVDTYIERIVADFQLKRG